MTTTFSPLPHEGERAPRLPAELRELPGGAAAEDSLRRIGAGERAQARAECARAAARAAAAYALGAERADPETVAAVAILLLENALLGVGGVGDVEGAATARPYWASALGSGRRHAGDGGAWDAALSAALAAERAEWRADGTSSLPTWEHDELDAAGWARLAEVLGVRYARVLAIRIVLSLGGEPLERRAPRGAPLETWLRGTHVVSNPPMEGIGEPGWIGPLRALGGDAADAATPWR